MESSLATSIAEDRRYQHYGRPTLWGGVALDQGTTQYALARPGFRETNTRLGGNRAVNAAIEIGVTGLADFLFSRMSKRHPKLATALGIAAGASSGISGLRNLHTIHTAGQQR